MRYADSVQTWLSLGLPSGIAWRYLLTLHHTTGVKHPAPERTHHWNDICRIETVAMAIAEKMAYAM